MLAEQATERIESQVTPEWVSYPDAERFSGLSHTSLWRRVKSGEIKSARVGRSVRIHLPSLREFMEQAAGETVAS